MLRIRCQKLNGSWVLDTGGLYWMLDTKWILVNGYWCSMSDATHWREAGCWTMMLYIGYYYDLSKKDCPSCLPEYLWFFCFDLSKLCEIRKQLEIIYPALLSISFYLYSFRNESVLKMHMHFGWEKNVHLLRYTGFVALPFTVIFFRFFFHYLFFIMSHLSLGKKELIVILYRNGFFPPKHS